MHSPSRPGQLSIRASACFACSGTCPSPVRLTPSPPLGRTRTRPPPTKLLCCCTSRAGGGRGLAPEHVRRHPVLHVSVRGIHGGEAQYRVAPSHRPVGGTTHLSRPQVLCLEKGWPACSGLCHIRPTLGPEGKPHRRHTASAAELQLAVGSATLGPEGKPHRRHTASAAEFPGGQPTSTRVL